MLPPSVLLHQQLQDAAQVHGAKPAAIVGERVYSFSEIHDLSDQLASALQESGIRRGDRVVICLGNRPETIVSFWAVLKAGGVVCNIGFDVLDDGLEYILRDSGAAALITTGERHLALARRRGENPLLNIVVDGDEGVSGTIHWRDVLSLVGSRPATTGAIDCDLAAIIYTSGSTGKPKGVMLTHRNMSAALASLNTYLDYNDTDTVLCSLPLSFDYGLYQMIMSISRGATFVLEPEFTWPIFLIKKIQQHEITIIPFVPTMLMLLHGYASRRGTSFQTVRMVTNTGAALKRHHIDQMRALFPEAQIFSMYGLTECKRCTYVPPQELERKPESIGVAIPNTELWLIDEEGTRISEPHRPGQLVIRGATVMAGYWGKPEATAERLKPGPVPGERVLHTGDLCSLDEDGYLYFHGRMDHVIKSRGIKVSPTEVEAFLYGVSGVEAAVVIGIEHGTAGGVLVAFVSVLSDSQLDSASIVDRCRTGLMPHQVPYTISIVDSLPRTPNGKFDIAHLRRVAEAELKDATIRVAA